MMDYAKSKIKNHDRICCVCGKKFKGYITATICSYDCRRKRDKTYYETNKKKLTEKAKCTVPMDRIRKDRRCVYCHKCIYPYNEPLTLKPVGNYPLSFNFTDRIKSGNI